MTTRQRLAAPMVSILLLAMAGGCIARKTGPPREVVDTEWSQFRGSKRTGVSPATGLLTSWPEEGPPLAYTIENVGRGFGSVAIRDGRLFVLGRRRDGEYLQAYRVEDGSPLWAHRIGEPYMNREGGGSRSTPSVDGKRVYALGPEGDLWAVTADRGEALWHVQILERYGGDNNKWGLSESPLVVDGKVICVTGDPEGSIKAFDQRTGEIVWQTEDLPDRPGYASAIETTVGDVRQVIHVTSEATVGVRVSDGEVLWRYEKASNSTANCTAPVQHDDRVFVTSGYDTGGALLALTPHGDGTRAEEVYFTREMKNHHGGVILVDGYLYGFSGSILTCLGFETGEVMWRHRSVGKGSLTAAEGRLYVLSENGVVGLVRATPERYEEISRFAVPVLGKNRSWAHPVVHDGRLYLHVMRDVHAYDIRAGLTED